MPLNPNMQRGEKMTQEFLNMLYLFGCGALGKEPSAAHIKDLRLIREKALSQEIWDVVYCAARKKILSGEALVPSEIKEKLEAVFSANVAANIRKIGFNLNTVRKLNENKIECCTLKGATVARLYAEPDARISSDTDILIDEKDEEKTIQLLKELGYEVEERAKYDHHRKARHKIGGLLEVHVSLHSKTTSDIILNDEIHYDEPFIKNEDSTVTLGIYDGLIYLSAHLIKHLINDAAGIRQMMDLLLYMKHYEKEIDWEKYNSLMKELRYDKLINIVKGIGVKYWGMEFLNADTDEDSINALLEDCEIGGAFAGNEERGYFYDLYTKKRSQKGKVAFAFYNLFSKERSVINILFPKIRHMKKMFPYVKKHPWLVVIAWPHRIIKKAFKMSVNEEGIDINEKQSLIIKRRMDLMKKLEMIDR